MLLPEDTTTACMLSVDFLGWPRRWGRQTLELGIRKWGRGLFKSGLLSFFQHTSHPGMAPWGQVCNSKLFKTACSVLLICHKIESSEIQWIFFFVSLLNDASIPITIVHTPGQIPCAYLQLIPFHPSPRQPLICVYKVVFSGHFMQMDSYNKWSLHLSPPQNMFLRPARDLACVSIPFYCWIVFH